MAAICQIRKMLEAGQHAERWSHLWHSFFALGTILKDEQDDFFDTTVQDTLGGEKWLLWFLRKNKAFPSLQSILRMSETDAEDPDFLHSRLLGLHRSGLYEDAALYMALLRLTSVGHVMADIQPRELQFKVHVESAKAMLRENHGIYDKMRTAVAALLFCWAFEDRYYNAQQRPSLESANRCEREEKVMPQTSASPSFLTSVSVGNADPHRKGTDADSAAGCTHSYNTGEDNSSKTKAMTCKNNKSSVKKPSSAEASFFSASIRLETNRDARKPDSSDGTQARTYNTATTGGAGYVNNTESAPGDTDLDLDDLYSDPTSDNRTHVLIVHCTRDRNDGSSLQQILRGICGLQTTCVSDDGSTLDRSVTSARVVLFLVGDGSSPPEFKNLAAQIVAMVIKTDTAAANDTLQSSSSPGRILSIVKDNADIPAALQGRPSLTWTPELAEHDPEKSLSESQINVVGKMFSFLLGLKE